MENMSLEDFPIIDKNIVRSNQKDFLSSNYDTENLISMATSGSTGTPFVCYQNREKKRSVNAEIIYYSEKVGYRLGDNLSYIRTVVKKVGKSKLSQFIQNQSLINCAKLSDEGIEDILSQILKQSRNEASTLLGYASTYTAIKNYIRNKGVTHFNGNVVGLISGSDMLYDDTREAMEDFFGCTMVSRYSNEENGVIGQDEGVNNEFVINEASYIVEICDNVGKRISDGSQGRIIVTDLYNYAMPLIRYDTGDIGAIKEVEITRNGQPIRRRVIYNFGGRKTDVIYNTNGEVLSPHIITNNLWSFPEISQFQIIQKGEKSYKLLLNIPAAFPRVDELRDLMLSILGNDADISIELVSEIPVLSSGKRRYIINEWKAKK